MLRIYLFAESKARILGHSELYVKTGSSVTITCVISQGPHDLGTVLWYRDSIPVHNSPLPPQGTPRLYINSEWTDGLTSRLHITRALVADTGNYSCVPTSAEPASVNVHVINGNITCYAILSDILVYNYISAFVSRTTNINNMPF